MLLMLPDGDQCWLWNHRCQSMYGRYNGQVSIGNLTLAINDYLAIGNADAANGILLWWPMLVNGGILS